MSITISSEVLGTLSVTVAETTGVLSVSVLATAPAVLSMELGTPGPSPTITVGTTTTLAPGSPATVTDVGTALAAVFDFGIPQGTQGTQGIQGIQGPAGATGVIAATSPLAYNSGTQTVSIDLSAYATLESPTFTTRIFTPAIRNILNTDLVVDAYNDTGAGTHFLHNFNANDGRLLLATNGGGLTFPDATTQATAFPGFGGYAPLASPTFTGTPTLPTGTIAVTQTAADSTTALATTAFVTTADNLKANLASPTFTGTPTLPTGTIGTTQTPGDSTTVLATTAFVTTADALKAPLASPVFTGDPQAPTPATADNDTSIATTAFVKAQAYLTDAPSDSKAYVRQNAAWLALVSDIPDFAWYDHPPVNWNTNVANSATSTIASGNCVNLVTATATANSRASVYTWKSTSFAVYVSQFNGNAAFAQYRLNWSRKLAIFTALNSGSVGLVNANVDYYFVMGQPVSGFAGTFTDKGMGVHINTTAANVTRIRIIYHDGTSQKASSYVSFSTAAANNEMTNASVTLFSDGTGTIKLFAYSNVLQGLAITVTDGPTGVASTNHNVNVGASLITGATASQNSLVMLMPRVYFGL